ncbi:MAG: vitamin K epoxide reductase family protein [Candidatus Promineifilaceae bacterium]
MKLPRYWQASLIQLLAVPGMLIAYYLLLYHNGVLFTTCTINEFFDCGQVSGPGAAYSAIGPIPVALIGLLGYAAIFVVIWLRDWSPAIRELLPELVIGLVGVAFLFTLGLTLLELLVIHAFCQFCLYSSVIVLAMLVLALSMAIGSRQEVNIAD